MKVLYIEDEPGNVFLVRKILEKEKVEFYSSESGEGGVLLFLEHNPDVVLVDIHLPGLGGHEVAKIIRKNNKDVRLVAVSGSTDHDDMIIAQAIGFDCYISKPIDPGNFFYDICHKRFDAPLNMESKIIMEKYADKLIDKLQDKISELQKVNEKLARADKIKSNFISVASHELRTPMVPILGYLEMLISGEHKSLPEKFQSQLNKVYESSQKLSKIIDKIVDVARIEKNIVYLNKTQNKISSIIDAAISNVDPYLSKRKITLERHDTEDFVYCDFEKTVYSLTQIVLNAIKFSMDSSKIEIGFENIRKLLYVRDSGVGIDKDELENIFGPFFAGFDVSHHHSSDYEFMGRGIGLGLTIAKGFLDIQNFKILVESEGKGRGSTFYIQFLEN